MKLLKYITVLLLFLSCSTTKVKDIPVNVITVDFMDFFENDNIGLRINDKTIFKNVKMKSNVVGYAQNRVYVRANQNEELITKFGDKVIKIQNTENKKINLETTINNRKQRFIINPDNGKFVGFDKDGDSLYISQSRTPFEYM